MKLRPLKNDKDYEKLLPWIDGKFDEKVKMNSPQGESLQIALLLINNMRISITPSHSLIQ